MLVVAVPSFASHTFSCITAVATIKEQINSSSTPDDIDDIVCTSSGSPTFTTNNNKFTYNSTTNKLQIAGSTELNYEDSSLTNNQYVVEVTASTSTMNDNPIVVTMTITLTDVDEAPTVGRTGTQNVINENRSETTPIDTGYTFTANDEDAGVTATRSIATTGDSRFFQLASDGKLQVKINTPFDREAKHLYTVTITASSTQSGTTKTATRTVVITISNVDEDPWVTTTLSYTLDEGTHTNGTNTGLRLVFHNDAGENASGVVNSTGEDSGFFTTDTNDTQQNLKVSGTRTFDFETKGTLVILVSAWDRPTGPGNETSTNRLTIIIKDTDEPPNIEETGTQVALVENRTFATDTDTGYDYSATDPDNTGGNTTESIAATGDAASFKLVSGELQVKQNVEFDYEVKRAYTITISSTSTNSDAGATAQTGTHIVVINVGNVDEAPDVSKSGTQTIVAEGNFTAAHDTNIDIMVVETEGATDLTYSGGMGKFEVASDGDLEVKAGSSFDFETKAVYTITITATESTTGNTSQGARKSGTETVTINIRNVDESPTLNGQFNFPVASTGAFYSFSFPQNNFIDPEKQRVTYYDNSNSSWLNFNPQTRTYAGFAPDTAMVENITLSIATVIPRLSRFTLTVYKLTVIANKPPALSIRGAQDEDINENATRTEPLTIAFTVGATDPDANGMIASTVASDPAFTFNANGVLVMAANKIFDHEVNEHYTLTITATDDNSATTSKKLTLSITDANDAPVFLDADLTVDVFQGATVSVDIGRLISDQDGDNIVVSGITPSWVTYVAADQRFRITPPSNQSTMQLQDVTFTAGDGTANASGSPSFKIDVVDSTTEGSCSDCIAILTNGMQQLDENVHAAIRVSNFNTQMQVSILAATRNNRLINYVYAGPDKKYFGPIVRNSKGFLVNFKGGFIYDYEEKSHFTISIDAVQSGKVIGSKGRTITIGDVAEYPLAHIEGTQLTVEDDSYHVPFNIGYRISLNDPDDNSSGENIRLNNRNFGITTNNSIFIKASLKLDHTNPRHRVQTLVVFTGDSVVTTKIAAATVLVTVSPRNYPPYVRVVGAQTPINEGNYTVDFTTHIQLHASDVNNDPIAVGINNDKFKLNTTGDLIIKAGTTFDYETISDRLQVVRVSYSDGINLPHVEVLNINIADVNEAPSISRSGSQASLTEGTFNSVTDTGYTFTATDPEKRNVSFTTSPTTHFQIDHNTGKLQIKQSASFDYETASERNSQVMIHASDGGLTVSTVAIISFANTNDNAPMVNVRGTQVRINEGTYATDTNTGLMAVATDVDNDSVSFSSSNNKFKIASNGNIQVVANTTFDYEDSAMRSHVITITANDGSHTDTASITITISDINDTAPVLTRTGTQPPFNEGRVLAVTDTGYRFRATDVDSDNITFSVSDNRFLVNPAGSLQMKANAIFEYDVISERNLAVTVTASDGRNTATNVVTLRFNNIEEPPAFEQSGSSTLPESTNATGYQINTFTGINLRVFDPEGTSLTIVYSDDKFFVDLAQRRLMVRANTILDYENPEQRSFTLTITASSNGDTTAHTVTINVNNVYENVSQRNMTTSIYADNSQALSIALSDHVVVDATGANNVSYTMLANTHSWVSVNNRNVLVGMPPLVSESQTITLSIRVAHNAGSNSSTLTLVLPIVLNPKDYEEVSQAVLPDVFDAVIAQGTGAVVNRIASINEGGIHNTFDTELVAALRSNVDMINSNEINIYQLLQNREYALGFHDGDYRNTDLGVWMRFDFDSMDGEATNLTYDGTVFGFSSGVDWQFVNGGILGMAFSNNAGEIDFTQNINNRRTTGVYDLHLNTIQPYYSNSVGDIEYWMSFGVGTGDVEISETKSSVKTTNDLGLLTYAIGVDTSIFEINERSSLDLYAEMQQSKLSVEDKAVNRSDKDYDNRHYKAGVSYGNALPLSNDANLDAKVGLALVSRESKGLTDASSSGFELFTEMEFRSHELPLQISGDLSYLSVSDLSSFSGGLGISYRNTRSRLGSFIEIEPSYRSRDSIDIFDLVNKDDNLGESNLLLTSELGYGFGVIGGVLTPYGDYLINHNLEEYGLGIRYNQADKLTWSLGVNTENNQAQETKFGIEYKIIN